jgi:hypothetical protein
MADHSSGLSSSKVVIIRGWGIIMKEMVSMAKNLKWISVGTCFVFSLAIFSPRPLDLRSLDPGDKRIAL